MTKDFMVFYTTAFLEALSCLWVMKAWLLRNSHSYTSLLYGVSSFLVVNTFLVFLTWHNATERRMFAAYGVIYTLAATAWVMQGSGMKLYSLDLALIGICAATWVTGHYAWIWKRNGLRNE